MKFKNLLILSVFFIIGIVYAKPYIEYDKAFDTAQDFTITYKYVPNISTENLEDNPSYRDHWMFHWVQGGEDTEYGWRFEVGYWISQNSHHYEIKLGATNRTCYMIRFPGLEMEKGKEYYFTIVKHGNNVKFYVNGELYKGTVIVTKSHYDGIKHVWDGTIATFDSGDVTLPYFTLANATTPVNFYPNYHLGYMPRIDYGFIAVPYAKSEDDIKEDLRKLGLNTPIVKTPISWVIMGIAIVLLTFMMMGDKKWTKKQ
jgi:hypothetical protein